MLDPTAFHTTAPTVRKDVKFECLSCKLQTSPSLNFQCVQCGGAQKIVYPAYSKPLQGKGMNRYAPLLPLDRHHWSETTSSLQKLSSDLDVWAKNDGTLPIGNTKFRQAAVAVPAFIAFGVHHLVVASTGNSSNSYCHAARTTYPKLSVDVFVPESHKSRIQYLGDRVSLRIQQANFVETGERAKRYAAANGLHSDGGFFNPFRREGLKTAYLEAIEQFLEQNQCSPDFFVQAISSGMGIIAAYSAFQEALKLHWIDRIPAMIAVQQTSCAPVVNAYERGHSTIEDLDIERNPKGLAAAILRGNPVASYPYLVQVIESTKGAFVAVDENELRASKSTLAAEGIQACFAAAATLAGVRKLRESCHPAAEGKGVIMITGSKD